MKDVLGKSIGELRQLLTTKTVSAKEILNAHRQHSEAIENSIQAFNTETYELADKQAADVDKMVAEGKTLPPLAGIPLAVKDNICVPGYATTCSSKILENFIPPYEATVAKKLFAAGAICLGKTNMDEFAMGSSTENSAFKLTHNPWNTKMVPGGSSGGSAAAVASGQVTIAVGSDTGGSIRQPASFCGVVGMKPTYGVVSRFGLVAFASSLDQIGPFGRCVEDVALTLQAIAGHDVNDSTSIAGPYPDYVQALKKDVKGLRIGLISELSGEGIDDEVNKAVQNASSVFKHLGVTVETVSLPNSKHALPVYYLLATAEASANLARFDGVKYGLRDKDAQDILSMYYKSRSQGFGAEVKRRIMLGTFALSTGYYDAYYKKAQQVRRLIKNDFDKAFSQFDLIICPTSPTVAFAFGAKTGDPLSMYLSDIATIPANLAGIPGISIPCGFGQGHMPIGLQILAPQLGDDKLLQAAYAFEQATDFHKQKPPVMEEAIARA
jgi:aspartyl-tRNA(Asn)/glutamyl-tRNA(Gln) amidotransferase subunit A